MTYAVRSRPINLQTETELLRYSYVERTIERPVTQTRVTTTAVANSASVPPNTTVADYKQEIGGGLL